MAYSLMYAITRFANSVLTGPYKPTPGRADSYIYNADYEFYKRPSNWQTLFKDSVGSDEFSALYSSPPVSITVINKAVDSKDGVSDYITLIGVNPKGLSDMPGQPEFSALNILGRSSPYQVYKGGGARTVKVQIPLYRDLFFLYDTDRLAQENPERTRAQLLEMRKKILTNDFIQDWSDVTPEYIDSMDNINKQLEYEQRQRDSFENNVLLKYRETLRWFKALCYPRYTDTGIIAPRVALIINGDKTPDGRPFLEVEGIPQITLSYGDTYSHGCPVSADIDLSITEAVDPSFDQQSIIQGKDTEYVTWNPSK